MVEVRAAIHSMTWLTPSDQGLVETVVAYADQIEAVVADADRIRKAMRQVLEDDSLDPATRIEAAKQITTADAAITKVTGWLGPHLTGALRALGGGPAERKELAEGGAVGGRLAHLRSARQGNASSVDEASA